MLKNRIINMEKSLDKIRPNQENVDPVYKFFLTGDEGHLPDKLKLKDVQLAARKAKKARLKNCLELLKVFNPLKDEGEISDDEKSLFDYIENRVDDPIKLKYEFAWRHGKGANKSLRKLGLVNILQFDSGECKENRQN